MKTLLIVLSSLLLLGPSFAKAQGGVLTRAEVRAQLLAYENAGNDPFLRDWRSPAAQRRFVQPVTVSAVEALDGRATALASLPESTRAHAQ